MLSGGTQEYAAMVKAVRAAYPTSRFVGIGFSMGGNVLCKYLGENPDNQKQFVCALSVCQGYNALEYVSLQTIPLWHHVNEIVLLCADAWSRACAGSTCVAATTGR